MALIRRKKSSTKTTKAKTSTKTYEVDGKKYSSSALVKYHKELQGYVKQKLIKDFELPQKGEASKSKFHAFKAKINGIEFDSLNESRYYIYVLKEVRAGNITSFELQKPFEIIPPHIKNGKKVRKAEYISDFVLHMADGTTKVIDVKGIETDVFKLKKKMVEYLYPDVEIICVHYVAATGEWLTAKEYKARRKKKAA